MSRCAQFESTVHACTFASRKSSNCILHFFPGTELGRADLAAHCHILCVILVQSWQQLSSLNSSDKCASRVGRQYW